MAYISANSTRMIRNALKERFKNTKFSVRNSNHTAIHVTILSAPDGFVKDENGVPLPEAQINQYHYKNNGTHHVKVVEEMLSIINNAGEKPNYDRSESQFDHFDVGYYVSLHQGAWNKPFKIVKAKVKRKYTRRK
jgi:hypothetical protein